MAPNAQPSHRLRFDECEIDLRSGELWVRGKRVRLQDQPFQVLRVLLERRGEIVTRDELKQILWPADTFVDFDDGLNTAVRKIRDALGDSAEEPRFIETIPRRGYRFVGRLAEVRPTVLPLVAEESKESPQEANAGLSTSDSAVLPTQKAFLPMHWRVLLAGVAALAVFFVALVLYQSSSAKGARQPPIKSLAVLPLTNLSGDPTQEYLADGMTEALIGRLSEIHNLRVISRTSVTRFKGTHLSVPEIARTLQVDAIVEGSVIRDGSRIRVHAQLIRAATDEHFWSEAYDRELRDVLSLQSDVAQTIARKVEVTVTGEERTRLVAARSVSPEVYESYLKGKFAKSNNKAEIEESIAYFEDAIRKDPTFAPSFVALAEAYNKLGTIFVGAPPGEARSKQVEAARKALDLDPDLAEAHVLLADVLQKQWRWAEAESEYRRALELNPHDASAHLGLANWLMCQGRMEEALAWARRARELDPHGIASTRVGWILFNARRFDEAIRELRGVLAVHPEDATANFFLGFSLIANRQSAEAIPVLEKTVFLMDRSPGPMGVLVHAYAYSGRRPEALRLLAELKRRQQAGYVPPAVFVNAYFGLDQNDQGFVWLERAYQEQSNILQFLRVNPFFDPVRDDPRFKDLLRRVGLG